MRFGSSWYSSSGASPVAISGASEPRMGPLVQPYPPPGPDRLLGADLRESQSGLQLCVWAGCRFCCHMK